MGRFYPLRQRLNSNSNMFNPEQAEQYAMQNPAYRGAKERANTLGDQFAQSGLDIIDTLLLEVEHMDIAGRFKTDDLPEHVRHAGAGIVNPMYADLSEAEFKRTQLENDLLALRIKLIQLGGTLKDQIMDIEASKID